MKNTKQKSEKLNLQSMSITEEQKRKLRQLFPEVFNENKIDWEKLKATLGEELDNGPERYNMNWPGKADCFRIIQKPSLGTLKPCKKESLDWDKTQNLFIEGDNLEVLKLLQRSYYKQIKMIYIDPPYNTGKDFIYPDKYSETLETYLQYTGQKDAEGKKFSTNQETDGRFHSKWINMMYPRLFLARNLLKDDGVIFISIDDNEVTNLRKICDEIFGEENFIGQFIINSTPNGRDYGHIAKNHELCLFYSKNIDECKTFLLPDTDKQFKYSDEAGPFNIHPLYNSNEAFHRGNRPNLYYPFYLYTEQPIKELGENFYKIGLKEKSNAIQVFPPHSQKNHIPFVWRWSKDKSLTNLNKEIIGYKTSENGYRIVQKMRTNKKLIRSIISGKEFASRKGTAEVEHLFDGKLFYFPKPTRLIKYFLSAGTEKNSIILDFFAGSGTTAHAVYEKNLKDGGNRKYICVQLPEPTQENTEAYNAGYKNIADIAKERIRRAVKKIKQEIQHNALDKKDNKNLEQRTLFDGDMDSRLQETESHQSGFQCKNEKHKKDNNGNNKNSNMDLGFKVFKLEKSNFKIWDEQISTDKDSSKQIKMHLEELIDKKSTDEDLLYEILIKTGYPLTTKIKILKLTGKTVYSIENNALLICLETQITKDLIKEIARLKPARVVCLDTGFENNDQLKTNAFETFKSHGIVDFKTV